MYWPFNHFCSKISLMYLVWWWNKTYLAFWKNETFPKTKCSPFNYCIIRNWLYTAISRSLCWICSKLRIKYKNDFAEIILIPSLITLNTFDTPMFYFMTNLFTCLLDTKNWKISYLWPQSHWGTSMNLVTGMW